MGVGTPKGEFSSTSRSVTTSWQCLLPEGRAGDQSTYTEGAALNACPFWACDPCQDMGKPVWWDLIGQSAKRPGTAEKSLQETRIFCHMPASKS